MPWAVIGLYVLFELVYVAILAVSVGVMLLVMLIKYLCKSKPTATAADARKLPKRTDTAATAHDIPQRASQKPRRRLKWEKMTDDCMATSVTSKTGRKARRQGAWSRADASKKSL